MRSRVQRAVTGVVVVLALVIAYRAAARFPWADMASTMLRADSLLLTLAGVVSLSSLGAKGWAWQLLLRPVAPVRFWSAQEATLVGSAVNSLSVLVIGEAARIRMLMSREPAPLTPAVASVVWSRATEGIGLALCVLAATAVLDLPTVIRGAGVGATLALVGLIGLAWFRGWDRLPGWVPDPLRRAAATFGEIGSWRRLPAPVLLALWNWASQWATYHLVIVACGIPVSLAGSFTALLASNVGGALRATPANVGVTQATIAVALLPFGVKPAESVAAGVILQAVQVLPTIALALLVVGWAGLGRLKHEVALGGDSGKTTDEGTTVGKTTV
ncbi:MAG: flippase-like domain-containing protein [Gemmatimonadetes bacterium]|nr:flippase-like domain-containing protein [Gemmatimonadota bacterium]